MKYTNEVAIAAYASGLREFLNSEKFAQIDAKDLGIGINAFITQWKTVNAEYMNDEMLAEMTEVSVRLLDEYKSVNGIAPYVPTDKDMEILYEPFPATKSSWQETILNIENWHSKSLKKALSIRPADRHDFESHLYKMEIQFIREAAGRETGFLKDKVMRFTEGMASQPLHLLGTRMRDRICAEYIPDAPRYDQQSESQISFILGAVAFYLLVLGSAIKGYKCYQSRLSKRLRGGNSLLEEGIN